MDDFLTAFDERVAGRAALRFDEFVDLALYHPQFGYYRQPRDRVGYAAGTDFFTASTSGPIFGELVAAASARLLGERDPAQFTFIEIGAENKTGVLANVAHPFERVQTIRIGETVELAGKCVVFSNELFDAQPFRRFRFREGRWRELGVARLGADLHEVELSAPAPVPEWLQLPAHASGGYTIDAPIAATGLARAIARQPWEGLFVAIDYGKTWRELLEACPAGTARGYFRHTQSNDLLARPGQQDLTCHICWDWVEAALAEAQFRSIALQTQESFFVRHAESYLSAAIAADAAKFTARKQSLMQLLHGAHLGQKFQVLSAVR